MLNSLEFYKAGTKVKINCPYLIADLKDCTGTIMESFSISRNDEMIHYYVINIPSTNDTVVLEPTYITVKPEISTAQRIILLGLRNLEYEYIAKDKCGNIHAFIDYPIKRDNYPIISKNNKWYATSLATTPRTETMLNKYLGDLCNWEDEEPTSINWLLNETE